MIFDDLERMKKFLPPELRDAVKNFSASSPDGKTVLAENKLWISIFTVKSGEIAGKLWEVHRNFLDLQMVLEDEEYCLLDGEDACVAEGDYQAADDYQLFRHPGERYSTIRMVPGKALLIDVNEVHAPGVRVPGFEGPHKKLVAKIHKGYFTR